MNWMYVVVIAIGVGGTVGAYALGAEELAGVILAGVLGLIAPTPKAIAGGE